jgi:hypothetical protein
MATSEQWFTLDNRRCPSGGQVSSVPLDHEDEPDDEEPEHDCTEDSQWFASE